jgi:pimeloyl-ACP methyl ester carboxylesterase
MKRRNFVASVVAAGTSLAAPALVFAQTEAGTATPASAGAIASETGYAPVNGLQLYYEIQGQGEPLVLLHGAFGSIDLWGPILETLAEERQVVAVELQGHGHTADINRPLSYEQFADDVAGLMDHLVIGQADVVGYSMGGITGLRLAIQHPDRVRKLVTISASFRSDGIYPEILESTQSLTPEMFAGSPLAEAYLRHAPNPNAWPALIEKVKALEATEFASSEEEMLSITAPTLTVIGDADAVRPEHAVEMFRLLGGGVPGDLTGLTASQLAIIPGCNHVGMVVERTNTWLPMVGAFLDAPMLETE